MPYGNEKSLSDDEVYAVTAYLHINGLLEADARLTADALLAIKMPNREGFAPVRTLDFHGNPIVGTTVAGEAIATGNTTKTRHELNGEKYGCL